MNTLSFYTFLVKCQTRCALQRIILHTKLLIFRYPVHSVSNCIIFKISHCQLLQNAYYISVKFQQYFQYDDDCREPINA